MPTKLTTTTIDDNYCLHVVGSYRQVVATTIDGLSQARLYKCKHCGTELTAIQLREMLNNRKVN